MVRLVREPGTTPTAEAIRDLVLLSKNSIDAVAELFLYEAARADLMASQITPALQRGEIVLADRFYDSTTAYQGYGRKLDLAMVNKLNRFATGGYQPDLTLLFDLPLDIAMERRGKEPDRLEKEPRAFFERVRKGFQAIARREPRRIVVIDATASADTVFNQVKRTIDAAFRRWKRT